MIDENYNLKIADFGFAGAIEELLTEDLGTKGFKAPEIHSNKPYKGSEVDIFALGVVLFTMVAAVSPFKVADPSKDACYRAIAGQKAASFWRVMERKSGNSFSENFKALVISMIQEDPALRPSIAELFDHPWLENEIANSE